MWKASERIARNRRLQEGLDLLAARPLGGTKHGGDEAAFAVEHNDRLKSVFVVVGVEQPQLLTTVDRIERVVDVQRDPFGNRGEGLTNTDRPSPCPSAARRERPADSPTANIVDCEHNSRSMGERSSAILNIGSRRSTASLPSS